MVEIFIEKSSTEVESSPTHLKSFFPHIMYRKVEMCFNLKGKNSSFLVFFFDCKINIKYKTNKIYMNSLMNSPFPSRQDSDYSPKAPPVLFSS